jgi:hypothetical protein
MDREVEVAAATAAGAMAKEATLMEMAATPAAVARAKAEAKVPRLVDPALKAREVPKAGLAPKATEAVPRVVVRMVDPAPKEREVPKATVLAPKAMEAAPRVVVLTMDLAPKAKEHPKVDLAPKAMEVAPMDPHPKVEAGVVVARPKEKEVPGRRAMEVAQIPTRMLPMADLDPRAMGVVLREAVARVARKAKDNTCILRGIK